MFYLGQYAIRVMLDICLNGESDMLETPDLDITYDVQDTVMSLSFILNIYEKSRFSNCIF